MNCLCLLLAVLSIWDYPARFPAHRRLSRQFVIAVRGGNTAQMETICRKGVALLPDDPTWHYNLACSLAYFDKREDDALDALEKAIDLGFRDRAAIANDKDLKRLEKHRRYAELLEYADLMKTRPLLLGPMATVDATGLFGQPIALGEQNMGWDFDAGCFVAHLKLAQASAGGNVGDLYMNRDRQHALLNVGGYPGLTVVSLDKGGRDRRLDVDMPNVLFPYPVFGNCSRALLDSLYWRSIPRQMMTTDSAELNRMARFYLSNQTWVFPANADYPPVGTNGDVFASITPYWMTTAGRSWSDLPYLRLALEVSRSLKPDVKKEIVRRGLLAPTIQVLIRKSFHSVTNEADYLGARAHPTAFPSGGVNKSRLVAAAKALTADAIPPLAVVSVSADQPAEPAKFPELTYATGFAWAYVLRSDAWTRTFVISAKGASEFAFVQTHGSGVDVKVEKEAPDRAKVTIDRHGMLPTNRVDIAVFGRNPGTGWGNPSYVSFARMDPSAPYSDPVLTPAVPISEQK